MTEPQGRKNKPIYWAVAVIIVAGMSFAGVKFGEGQYLAGDPCRAIDADDARLAEAIFDTDLQRRSGGSVKGGFGVTASRAYGHGGCKQVLTRRACKIYGPAIARAELSGQFSHFEVPEGRRAWLSPTFQKVTCTTAPND